MCCAYLRSMRALLAIIIAAYCARCLFADQLPPLTVKDIGLMLRSGCSSEMIVRDVSARHFAGPLDSVGESELRRENASQALLDAIKSGNNTASQEELAQARKRTDDEKVAAQKAAEQEDAKRAQWATDLKKEREYHAELAAAQKVDQRVKTVLSSSFSDKEFSLDRQRVWDRARQVAGQEFPGRREAWRRPDRIQQLVQDETFVRDT
jgi:hypothetical protein